MNTEKIIFTDCTEDKLWALRCICQAQFGSGNFVIKDFSTDHDYAVPLCIQSLFEVLRQRITLVETAAQNDGSTHHDYYAASLQKAFLKADETTYLLTAGSLFGKVGHKKHLGLTTGFPLAPETTRYIALPKEERYRGLAKVYPKSLEKPLIEILNNNSENERDWYRHAFRAAAASVRS